MSRWKVTTGSIDIIGVEAETPMEAATKVFETIHKEGKIEKYNRIYNIGLVTECTDIDNYKKDPNNNIFYVLSSKVLANAGLHSISRELELAERKLKNGKKKRYR